MSPAFSVVIPTYNQADFLRVALRSVLDQTFEDFEIIVVNNYSSDHTLDVISEFKDPRLQSINFKNNGVIGAGRNVGIKASRAPYIAFLDSDDTWRPKKLAEVAQIIEEDPEIGLVAHLQEMVWDGPVKTSTNFGPPPGFSQDVYEYLLLVGNLLATSSAVVRRDRLEQVGLFSEETALVTAEDFDLWLKLAKVCRFHFIADVLGENRVHLDSASSNIERHVSSVLAVLNQHFQPASGPQPTYSNRAIRRRYSTVYYYGGRLHQRTGKFKMPLSYYIKAIKTYPLYVKTYAALGVLLTDRILGRSLGSKFEYGIRGIGRRAASRSRIRRQNQPVFQLRLRKELDRTMAETDGGSAEGAVPRPYKLAIIAPTPFYYQVPIFQRLSLDPLIDLTVYFCSRESIDSRDLQILYNSTEEWGEENLLEGYKSKFMRNYSPWASYLKTPFGLANLGVWKELSKAKPDVVVLMGWTNPTWWLAIVACLKNKIPFLYMNDANVQVELSQAKWKSIIKHLALGKVIFRLAAGFLSSGSANNELYRYFGVPPEKLIPFGYSMVHQILLPESEQLQSQKGRIRDELGIHNDGFVILFCGRFIKQKGVFELLEAFQRLERPNKTLVFVGGGKLEQDLKAFVTANDINSVHFFGFQSRKDLPKYYAMADVLVLPSWRETWGMVVNEALCFGLPVVVSDQVGAAPDLIKIGSNGYTFPYKNVQALTCSIDRIMNFSEEERSVASATSRELITNWSNRDLVGPLISYLHKLLDPKREKDRVA